MSYLLWLLSDKSYILFYDFKYANDYRRNDKIEHVNNYVIKKKFIFYSYDLEDT